MKRILFLAFLSGCGISTSTPHIYGGFLPSPESDVAKSTVALLSESDDATGLALVEGSGTLVAPGVIVGAAHTCLLFHPRFAHFGPTPPSEDPWNRYSQGSRYPTLRRISRCVAHPSYDVEAAHDEDPSQRPVNDVALFFIDSAPGGHEPSAVVSPSGGMTRDVLIAGFGAHEGQFDALQTTGMEPYALRAVETFVTKVFPSSHQFQDGPNPGRGSCQGDSGGSVYARVGGRLVLIGLPVNGPECNLGIGINTDLRPFVSWISAVSGARLTLVSVNPASHREAPRAPLSPH